MGMKILSLIFSMLFIVSVPKGIAGASIFETGTQFDARVKAIAVDKNIRIKFEDLSKDEGDREVFLSLCLEKAVGNNGRMLKSESMELIRTAMKTGQRIRIGYSSLFDRCIKSVELIKKNQPTKDKEIKDPQSV